MSDSVQLITLLPCIHISGSSVSNHCPCVFVIDHYFLSTSTKRRLIYLTCWKITVFWIWKMCKKQTCSHLPNWKQELRNQGKKIGVTVLKCWMQQELQETLLLIVLKYISSTSSLDPTFSRLKIIISGRSLLETHRAKFTHLNYLFSNKYTCAIALLNKLHKISTISEGNKIASVPVTFCPNLNLEQNILRPI